MQMYAQHEVDRFMEGVSKTPTDTGCLLWTRSLDRTGYGQVMMAGKATRSHRVAYEIHHNVRLSPDNVIMHMCDTPRCCNPGHLQLGTQSDNLADMRSKNRHAHGARNGTHVLTDESVLAMRKEWAASPHRTRWNPTGITMIDLAKKYGLADHATVGAILRGEMWTHVGGPIHKGRDFLSDETVRAIRAVPLSVSSPNVARTFGITVSAVVCIRSGKTYRHVE